MDKVRIDKWLWSVRLFKTRSIAANECKSGSVKINENKAKPSSLLIEDNLIYLRKNGFNLVFKVTRLIDKRVSAVLALKCYEDLTSEEEINKYKNWFVGKNKPERRDQGVGRPTKKERREIELFKGNSEFDLE